MANKYFVVRIEAKYEADSKEEAEALFRQDFHQKRMPSYVKIIEAVEY